jgi:hypothetical protein
MYTVRLLDNVRQWSFPDGTIYMWRLGEVSEWDPVACRWIYIGQVGVAIPETIRSSHATLCQDRVINCPQI